MNSLLVAHSFCFIVPYFLILFGNFESVTMKRVGGLGRPQQPNRFTKAFKKMKEVCPVQIQAYATCVMKTEASESITKGSCEKEFALVKECFRQVRALR